MTPNGYQQLALRTMADQNLIRQRIYELGPKATQLDNAVRGLSDEVGEINNLVKKHLEYGQDLDTTNLLEEAGDALWRLAQLLDAAGMTIEMAMHSNIKKLMVRYPDGYSDVLAANRDLEAEKVAVEKGGKTYLCATSGCANIITTHGYCQPCQEAAKKAIDIGQRFLDVTEKTVKEFDGTYPTADNKTVGRKTND